MRVSVSSTREGKEKKKKKEKKKEKKKKKLHWNKKGHFFENARFLFLNL